MHDQPNGAMVPLMRIIIGLCAVLLSACHPATGHVITDAEIAAAEAGGVLRDRIRVIDGDTLAVDGERIRISNIDTPERGDGAKCWAEAALAEKARLQLVDFVNVAKTIELAREGRDRYGRTLARLKLDGHDVGEAMVESGYAARWNGSRWPWCTAKPTLKSPYGPLLNGADAAKGL